MPREPVELTIRKLERQRYHAMRSGDIYALGTLLSEELIYTHTDGRRDSKVTYLESLNSGEMTYEMLDVHIEKVVIADRCALVAGQMTAVVQRSYGALHLDNSTLATWAFTNQAWSLLGFAPTVNHNNNAVDRAATRPH